MRIFFIFSVLFLTVLPAQAETIVLKNGSTINGTITQKNAKNILADVGGVQLTYYVDDILTIDGKPAVDFVKDTSKQLLSDLPPAMTKPAPVPTPPAVQPGQPQAAVPTAAKPPELAGLSKKDLILKFIEVFGTKENMVRNFEELITRTPPNQVEEVKKAINVDELIQELVPIYDRHFTEQELIDYITFYTSPEGKKLLDTIPTLMEESVGVSMKYFKEKLADRPRI